MQVGWIYNGEDWTHAAMMEVANKYPPDFPYTPQMLEEMYIWKERDYISATMISGCAREQVLRRGTDYMVPLDYAYASYRGTVMHAFLEDGTHEPDAIIEQQIEVQLALPDGRLVTLKSTPDKVIPSQRLLIDYKSVKEIVTKPKASWVPQMSVYRWMLHHCGVEVDRAIIQQISMERPHRVLVELWPLDKTEQYLLSRVPQFMGVFDGTFDVAGLLPPVLDAKLDSDLAWKCGAWNNKEAWCPVARVCRELAEKGR